MCRPFLISGDSTVKSPNQYSSFEDRVAYWAPRQAQRAINNARGILFVDKERNPLRFVRNDAYNIGAIAVIGPARVSGTDKYVDQAVLIEIGSDRSYPYRRGYGYNGSGNIVSSRNPYFPPLTLEEIENILPGLEKGMLNIIEHALEGVGRKTRNPKSMRSKKTKAELPASLRFSVAWRDKAMAATLLRSELVRRKRTLLVDMHKRAQWIQKNLYSVHDMEYAPDAELVREIERKNSGLRIVNTWITNRLNTMPPHYWALVLQNMRGMSAEGLLCRLMDRWGVDRRVVYEWDKLIRWDTPLFSKRMWLCSAPMLQEGAGKARHNSFAGHILSRDHFFFDVSPADIVSRDTRLDIGERAHPPEVMFSSEWVPF